MSFALYERHGAVGIVTLNRPDRLNAISDDLLRAFAAALEAGIADDQAAALILAGAGRAFCSGDDLKEFSQQVSSPEAIRNHIVGIQQITRLMRGCSKPIVGAVQGYAVGGGFEWLLNCDLVVAADDLVAFFPEMEWGQFVTGGVTHLLPQTVGYQRAMELLVLGERQSALRLQELNLVNFVVPRCYLETKTMEVANKIANKPRFSVGRLKTLLNQGLGDPFWQAVALEEAATIEAVGQPGVAERIARFTSGKQSL